MPAFIQDVTYLVSAATAAFVRKETVLWRRVIATAGITPD